MLMADSLQKLSPVGQRLVQKFSFGAAQRSGAKSGAKR
jgi:hypothetical protein